MGTLNGWLEDLRYAARRLARTPLFTVAAIAILAIGIGANAATFSVVDAAVFRPPPFERPEEVVRIYQDSDDGNPSNAAYPAYLDLADLTDVFAGVAATSPDFNPVIWDLPTGAIDASATYATSSYFPVLGLRPTLGTWFLPEQDRPGAGFFAVVTHRTWTTRMGGDAGVIGSTVRLNGQPVTIVGVGPESFNGTVGALVIDFWLSISSVAVGGEYRVGNLERREDHWYQVMARLAPGVSLARARAAADALAMRQGELYPEFDRGRGLTVYASDEVRLSPQIDGVLLPVGVALLVVAGLVLLLACSNLANLVLVRGLARSPEMIVRRALGAGPGRISRLFLVEALLLSSLGGVAGLLAAKWAIDLFPRLPLPLPEGMILDVGIDGRVLAFGAILALSSGAIFGVLPSLRVGGDDLAAGLREDLRSGTDGKRGTLLRNGLVAIQVAAAVVLLIGAGLFARSLANVRGADTGVDVERIAVLGLDTSRGGTSPDVAPLLFREIQDRVVTLPGVTAAAVSTQLPARTLGGTTTIVEGYVPPTGTEAVELAFSYVSPGYFETMGIRLLEGRDFSLDDRPENPRVIIVNETAARVFWGGEGLGKRTRSQGANTQWREVVGVVADAKVGSLQEPPTPMMYYSTSQGSFSCCFVIARTAGDPEALLPSMNAVAAEIAPGVPITTLGTFASVLGEGFAGPRAAAALMGVFSALALVLAGLGIYAVVAFAVLRRAGEMGIRVALGATRSQVARLVLKDSLASSGIGLGVGLVAAFGLTPGLEGLLFQVGVVDPAIFLGAAAFLLAVTLTASWFPAWRAASADPAQVLRAR